MKLGVYHFKRKKPSWQRLKAAHVNDILTWWLDRTRKAPPPAHSVMTARKRGLTAQKLLSWTLRVMGTPSKQLSLVAALPNTWRNLELRYWGRHDIWETREGRGREWGRRQRRGGQSRRIGPHSDAEGAFHTVVPVLQPRSREALDGSGDVFFKTGAAEELAGPLSLLN